MFSQLKLIVAFIVSCRGASVFKEKIDNQTETFAEILLPDCTVSVCGDLEEANLTVYNLAYHSSRLTSFEESLKRSKSSSELLSAATSLTTVAYQLPLHPSVKYYSLDPLTDAHEGTTTEEAESNSTISQESTVNPLLGNDPLFIKILKQSASLRTFMSFLTPQEQEVLSTCNTQVEDALRILPAHRLASIAPQFVGLFDPVDALNDSLARLLQEACSEKSGSFAKLLKAAFKVTQDVESVRYAYTAAARAKFSSAAFDQINSFIWTLISKRATELSLGGTLYLILLIDFVHENVDNFMVNKLGYNVRVGLSRKLMPSPLEIIGALDETRLQRALFMAVRSGMIRFIQLMTVELSSSLLIRLLYLQPDEAGWTGVHIAAIGDKAMMLDLLVNHIPLQLLPDIADSFAPKSLLSAAYEPVSSYLFPSDALVRQNDRILTWFRHKILTTPNHAANRVLPLWTAVIRGNLSAARFLHSQDPAKGLNRHALHFAVFSKSLPMLDLVLEWILNSYNIAFFLTCIYAHLTPLQLAYQLDWPEGVRRLESLKNDYLRESESSAYETATKTLFIAAKHARLDLFNELLSHTPARLLKFADEKGKNVYDHAFLSKIDRDLKIVCLWANHFQDPLWLFRVISYSPQEQVMHYLRLLLNDGKKVDEFLRNTPLLYGKTTFFTALILSKNTEALQWFLSNSTKVDLRSQDSAGNAPIHVAVMAGNVDALKMFLKIDPNCVHLFTRSGDTVATLLRSLPAESAERIAISAELSKYIIISEVEDLK